MNYKLVGHRPVPVSDVIEWALEFEKTNRVVAKSHVGDLLISTVFLGVDHNFLDIGPPLLFETMVFDENGDGIDRQRYSTWDEAQAGHDAIVKKLIEANS